MKNKYVLGIIAIAIIVGLGLWWNCAHSPKTLTTNINNKNSMNKTYMVTSADLTVSENKAVFNHNLKPGWSINTFIVTLPNQEFLVTKFGWAVVENPVAEQVEGGTYLVKDGKFTPVSAQLSYNFQTMVLDGKVLGTTPTPIHVEVNDMVKVEASTQFSQITSLTGFENAEYVDKK